MTNVGRALEIIKDNSVDGDMHKQWVLDQVVRALCKTEENYTNWVLDFEQGEDGPHTYSWNVGIAP